MDVRETQDQEWMCVPRENIYLQIQCETLHCRVQLHTANISLKQNKPNNKQKNIKFVLSYTLPLGCTDQFQSKEESFD